MGFFIEVRPPELAGAAGLLWGHASDASAALQRVGQSFSGNPTGDGECNFALATFHASWVDHDLAGSVRLASTLAENLSTAAESYAKSDDTAMRIDR